MEIKKVSGGQLRPYSDSVYVFEVTSDKPEDEVEKHCTQEVKRCNNKSQGGRFDGSCSFPFGLNSYYKFSKVTDNKYRYTVCEPYTG